MARMIENSGFRFDRLRKHGYRDPVVEALDGFHRFLYEPNAYASSDFGGEEGEVECFYDLALAWLIEGDGARWCPTFESWLVFLISLAEAIRRMRPGSSGEYWRDAFAEHAVQQSSLQALDLFLWKDPDPAGMTEQGSTRHDGDEGFGHRVLRRDVYDIARESYKTRQLRTRAD